MPTIYIADVGPDEIVVYADPGDGTETREHSRFARPEDYDLDGALEVHGWYRLRAWRAPHDAPDHLAAQVTPWSPAGFHGTHRQP